MFRVYIYQDISDEISYYTKNRRVTSLNQSISLWKQMVVAVTFEIATAILKDFFHFWSSYLIHCLIAFDTERVSCLYVSYLLFIIAKPLATDI